MEKNDLKEEIQRLFSVTDSIDCATPENPVYSETLASVLLSVVNILEKLVNMPVFDPGRNVHGVIRAEVLDTSDHSGLDTPMTNAPSGCELVLECEDGDPYNPTCLNLYDRENRRLYFLDEDGNRVNDVYKDYLLFNEHGVYIITEVDGPYIRVKVLSTE